MFLFEKYEFSSLPYLFYFFTHFIYFFILFTFKYYQKMVIYLLVKYEFFNLFNKHTFKLYREFRKGLNSIS